MKNKQENRTKRQKEINELKGHESNTGIMEQSKMSILASLIEDLEDSINENSKTNSKLTKAIIGLYVVIAVATIALAIIGGGRPLAEIK